MGYFKKILIFLPVLLSSIVFLGSHYLRQYEHATPKRLLALIISVVIFYIWVLAGIARRRQVTFLDMLLESSFYVYIFSVLTLTGYFILFNQVSGHNWWQTMEQKIAGREGVNLEPFTFLKGHHIFTYDVVGNFIMLLPLGIYLPLLYKNIKGFFAVTFCAMLVSVSIELMQLATNVRISDINDVILNTSGAAVGYIIYFLLFKGMRKTPQANRGLHAVS